jgi:hypothetical protein
MATIRCHCVRWMESDLPDNGSRSIPERSYELGTWFENDCAHIIVSKQRFPYLALGRCPTQSTINIQKDSSETGTGRSGAIRIFWFGFPITWQMDATV